MIDKIPNIIKMIILTKNPLLTLIMHLKSYLTISRFSNPKLPNIFITPFFLVSFPEWSIKTEQHFKLLFSPGRTQTPIGLMWPFPVALPQAISTEILASHSNSLVALWLSQKLHKKLLQLGKKISFAWQATRSRGHNFFKSINSTSEPRVNINVFD